MTIQRTAKKFFGLLFLYCCIILGIFALQFRNELLYTKNFGQLKVTLRQSRAKNQDVLLKNTFQITYKGLLVFADNSHPLVLFPRTGDPVELTLADYQEDQSGRGFSLIFEPAARLHFTVSDSGQSGSLSVQAELPRQSFSLQVPYKSVGGFILTEGKPESILFASQNELYQLSGTQVENSRLTFTPQKTLAGFNPYVPTVRLQYAALAENPKAQQAAYAESLRQFRAAFLAEMAPTIATSMVERDIVAYVAEMAYLNNYQQALDSVSPAFKTDSRRSYLSVPYFGNTAGLNSSLTMYYNNQVAKVQQAQTSRRLDIFESDKLADFLLLRPDDSFRSILAIPSEQNPFQPTVTQAAGILETYAALQKNGGRGAALLEPVLQACLDRVADAFKLVGGELALESGATGLTPMQVVKTANALIKYGTSANRRDVAGTGYFLFNSLMASGAVSGMQSYADLYPYAVENPYYPHMAVLSANGALPIWAWTCSPAMSWSVDAEKTVTAGVRFSVGNSHYMIVNGIEPFGAIEMYGLRYRSDREFESYNSSGYVFLAAGKTLLLKVRNRAENEIIRLFYPAAVPAAAAAAPATANSEAD